MYTSQYPNLQNIFLNKIKSPYFASFLFVFACLVMSGCSSENPIQNKVNTQTDTNSTSITPPTLSPELNTIFNETCSQCHLNNATGAPKAGDVSAWKKILAKGIDETLERVMNGFGGMPPAGQCFECSPEQLIELINFMSTEAIKTEF